MMYSIPQDRLNELFAKIAESYGLYMPQNDATGKSDFKLWTEGAELSDNLNTRRSAKDFFFPQMEDYAKFKVEGKSVTITPVPKTDSDFVVFGVRACDAESFGILDTVFLADPVDGYYKARREHATVVVRACSKPAETCFCNAVGIDAVTPKNGDATTWFANGKVYIEAYTDKGEKLIEKVKELLEDANAEELSEETAKAAKIMANLPLGSLPIKGMGERREMMEIFEDKNWKDLSSACLACGTCTYVCPTCQCYDIKEYKCGDDVTRFRCWDSCMYSEFTKMSAGQPRPTQVERFRQRFMHKLVYYPKNFNGKPGCVGCGRCLAACPISMNIIKVAKTLIGEEKK